MPRHASPRPVSVLALMVVASLAVAAPAQEKIKLGLKGTAGETYRRKSEITVKLESEGQKISLEQKEQVLVTVKEVKADGSIVTSHKVESQSRSFNGEKVPNDESSENEEYIATEAPDGRLLAYEDKKPDPDDKSHLNERLFQAGSVIFSPNPVGKGDKWKFDFEANTKLGTPKATANFVLESIEDIDGVKTARIKVDYKELEGKAKLEYSGTSWIELASGDEVKSNFTILNIEFGSDEASMLGIGTGVSQRVSGSPLKGAQGAKPVDTAPAAKKDDEETIDKRMKDFEKVSGLFTLYKRTKDGRQQIFLELKEDQLDKLFMLQATASTGTMDGRIAAGDPISDQVFSFKKMPTDKIYVVSPNYNVKATGSKEDQVSVSRSFPDQYVDSYRIEAKQPDRKSLLIDITGLFLSDFAQLSSALGGAPGANPLMMALGASQPDRERSYVSELKVFPTNLFAQTTFVFPGRARNQYWDGPNFTGDGRGMVLKLDYNLFQLPINNGFKPRAYDSRIGYFTTDYLDFANYEDTEKREQLILRWNLKKKDPSVAVSEPVEPIVFWLDNAIPQEWRQVVGDSILQWNSAFEKAGFKNAVVVKQMPDNADWDHADMRYNLVRWVSSNGGAYAVANVRHNPLTGQILNASITVDSNMVRFASGKQDLYSGALSKWARVAKVDLGEKFKPTDVTALPEQNHGQVRCELEHAAMANRDYGLMALDMLSPTDAGPEFRATYIKQFLKEVVGHEMGHILGLRHNFVASTELTFAELGDPAKVAIHGNSASIMDYLPFNPHGLKSKQIPFYSQTLGTYDLWAIGFGYKDFPAIDAKDELRQLKAYASATNEPGKKYLSDEFADGVDPYVVRFDSGKDPISYFIDEAELSTKLMRTVGDRYPKNGDSFYSFTQAFNRLLNTRIGSVVAASSFLGGVQKNPNFKGDPNEQPPIRPVDATTQRKALDAVAKYIFAKDAFAFPKRYYQLLATNPKNTFAMVNGVDFDMLQLMEFVERLGVAFTLSPDVLGRLMDQEFKSEGGDVLTAAEVVKTVDAAVWEELATREEPPLLRRSLQRSHVDALIALSGDLGSSGEVRQLARTNLRSLVAKLKTASATGTIKAHYSDIAERIQKYLDAKPVIRQ